MYKKIILLSVLSAMCSTFLSAEPVVFEIGKTKVSVEFYTP